MGDTGHTSVWWVTSGKPGSTSNHNKGGGGNAHTHARLAEKFSNQFLPMRYDSYQGGGGGGWAGSLYATPPQPPPPPPSFER